MTVRGFQTVFAPSEALMRRLKLGQKFAVIAVVLVIPLAFVTNSYLSVQNHKPSSWSVLTDRSGW